MSLSEDFVQRKIAQLRQVHGHAGDFCFFTDVTNLPSIVNGGALLSRNKATTAGIIRRDCAATTVLDKTPAWVKDYVRLYFAPQTPMLFRVEGIKRTPDEWPECPAPVYLVFRPAVLSLDNVLISDGNMGSQYTTFAPPNEAYFNELPFHKIYHRGSLAGDGIEIVRCRHAEVLVRDQLSLAHLEKLVFRSQAEQELALSLAKATFPTAVDKSWFNCRRPYLDSVTLAAEGKRRFTIANRLVGDYLIKVQCCADGQIQAQRVEVQPDLKWGPWVDVDFNTLNLPPPGAGKNRLYLLGHLVAEWA